jgi:ribosomal protein S18 acetylase RimI-like enzyme
MNDFARFVAFERRLVERLSTRSELYEYGIAYFDDGYRDRYNSNFLLADRNLDHVSARALMEAADHILGRDGFRHREVDIKDDAIGEQLYREFAEQGYLTERNAIMLHKREPDRIAGPPVEELAFNDVAPLIEETYRRVDWATSEEMVQSFTDQHNKYAEVIGARFFAARIDGALAGNCELYSDGLDAQIENVGTLEEYRGKGIARAVVLGALSAARASGARHVFIVADEDDWPKSLYSKLGFDRIGRTWQFIRWPEDERSKSARSL